MDKYMKPVTKSRLLDLYEGIYKMPIWTGIARSIRKRRLRDPEHPEKLLPVHGKVGIDFQNKARLAKVIERLEAYIAEAKRKLNAGTLK